MGDERWQGAFRGEEDGPVRLKPECRRGQAGRATLATLCPHLRRVYNTTNGKQKKCYKGSQGDEGSLLKVSSWDPRVKSTHIPPCPSAADGPPETCGPLGT